MSWTRSLPFLLVAFAACSSGSSGPSGSPPQASPLLLSTDTEGTAEIRGIVDGVFYVTPDGVRSQNMLSGGSQEVVFADPEGMLTAIPVEPAPGMDVAEIEIAIRDDSLYGRDNQGRIVDFESPENRIVIQTAQPLATGRDAKRARHAARLDLRQSSQGKRNWSPNVSMAQGDSFPIRHTHGTVLSKNPGLGTMQVLLKPWGAEVSVEVVLSEDTAFFTKDPWTQWNQGDFLQFVQVGERLRLEGNITSDLQLLATYLEVRDPDPLSIDVEVAIVGTLVAQPFTGQTQVDIQLLGVDRWPGGQAPSGTVSVDAAGVTMIEEGTGQVITLQDLSAGDRLRFTGDLDANNNVVMADEASREPPYGASATDAPVNGVVVSVGTTARTITMLPDGAAPGGEVVVNLGPSTVLYDRGPSMPITLADVAARDDIRVWGARDGNGGLDATKIRIKSPGGNGGGGGNGNR